MFALALYRFKGWPSFGEMREQVVERCGSEVESVYIDVVCQERMLGGGCPILQLCPGFPFWEMAIASGRVAGINGAQPPYDATDRQLLTGNQSGDPTAVRLLRFEMLQTVPIINCPLSDTVSLHMNQGNVAASLGCKGCSPVWNV